MSATPLKLVIFDVDGTLIDSQALILHAMQAAFDAVDLPPPDREALLSVVGLSLPLALAGVAPGQSDATVSTMVETYKQAYHAIRSAGPILTFYPGALDTIKALHAQDEVLLGVATGKSKRGLDHVLDVHDLRPYFVTTQVSDHHPSKPHPSMVLTALSETGVAPENAVMIGDTSFDMEMGAAAGVATIGVGWGYHPVEKLASADRVIMGFDGLPEALDEIWG